VPVQKYKDQSPQIDSSVFLATSSYVIGEVEIKENSSIWYGCLLRGDVNYIKIGKDTNIQDNTVVHVTGNKFPTFPTVIGDRVTVGHAVNLHGCIIKDLCLIGIGSIVLDGSIVEEESIIGAGSLVTEGSLIPSGVLAVGSPAKVKRKLSLEEKNFLRTSAQRYVDLSRQYLQGF